MQVDRLPGKRTHHLQVPHLTFPATRQDRSSAGAASADLGTCRRRLTIGANHGVTIGANHGVTIAGGCVQAAEPVRRTCRRLSPARRTCRVHRVAHATGQIQRLRGRADPDVRAARFAEARRNGKI
jgi:5-methylcytosine-specific restriction endonuclease McrA